MAWEKYREGIQDHGVDCDGLAVDGRLSSEVCISLSWSAGAARIGGAPGADYAMASRTLPCAAARSACACSTLICLIKATTAVLTW